MATVAIWILIAYALVAVVARVTIQLIRTGRTGLVGVRRGAGPVGWVSAALFNGGGALVVISVVDVHRGALGTVGALDVGGLHALGIVLAVAGGLITFLAQLRMGASWRVGVNESERTELITGGWFSIARNPIYTSMIAGFLGFALMVPTWLGLSGVVAMLIGLELQVRAVEEPYLLRTHGDEYRSYAARVGRFVPGVGRRA